MRAAPPVQAVSSAAGAWRAVQQALYVSTAGSLGFWALSWWVGPGALSVLGSAGAMWAAWIGASRFDRRLPQRLVWNGTAWSADGPGVEPVTGHAQLMIDLGSWVLVRVDAQAASRLRGPRPRWLPLRRGDNPGVWHGLRVALHAPGVAPDSARPPALPRTAGPGE